MGELRKIPGAGKETEKDLIMFGNTIIKSLRNANPEALYEKECLKCGGSR